MKFLYCFLLSILDSLETLLADSGWRAGRYPTSLSGLVITNGEAVWGREQGSFGGAQYSDPSGFPQWESGELGWT